MSSSIFKDLEKERQIEEREREYEREIEAMQNQRYTGPEIIYESEWHQGFGSEAKEYIGIDSDQRFYYALEIGDAEDFSWHGPYDTRGEAEEQLELAYNCWDERVSKREEAWEAQQIARFENRTPAKSEDLKEQIEALDQALEFNATKRAAELRTYISIDQIKVGELVRLEAVELRAQRDRLYNQLRGLNVEPGFKQEMGIDR